MYFFKKNISNCLYIFFIFLTFNFIEFSTKEVLAKTFVVSKIEVEEKYNLSFNKLKVMDRGFKKAFQDISQMILERKDLDKIKNTPINCNPNLLPLALPPIQNSSAATIAGPTNPPAAIKALTILESGRVLYATPEASA